MGQIIRLAPLLAALAAISALALGCVAPVSRPTAPLTADQQRVVAEKLTWQPFKTPPARAESDHAHCVFCGAQLQPLGSENRPQIQTDGYATADGELWVCNACFDRLNPKYRWSAR